MKQSHAEAPPPGYTTPLGAEVVSSSRYAIGVLGVTDAKLSWRYPSYYILNLGLRVKG